MCRHIHKFGCACFELQDVDQSTMLLHTDSAVRQPPCVDVDGILPKGKRSDLPTLDITIDFALVMMFVMGAKKAKPSVVPVIIRKGSGFMGVPGSLIHCATGRVVLFALYAAAGQQNECRLCAQGGK